jgi:hypothetical protein
MMTYREHIELPAFTIGQTTIETSREEFAVVEGREEVGEVYDAYLSDMSEETVIIDPDGNVISPYGREVDLMELLRPILAHVPLSTLRRYVFNRETGQEA